MDVGVVTLLPEMFDAMHYGIVGRALDKGIARVRCWNPREYTHDKHRMVDDKPYGGGPGMLMKVQPLRDAIHAAKADLGADTQVIYVSPKGQRFDHRAAETLARQEKLIFLAGRYEGVDERLIESEVDAKWSIGDYVLSGGELAVMVMLDAIFRMVPGVVGDVQSVEEESFAKGLLDYPHYTRPAEVNGLRVPEVLLSGDHKAIETWRMKQALGYTFLYRPDLLEKLELSADQQTLLDEFKQTMRKES